MKAYDYTMILTNRISGEKFKVKMLIETVEGGGEFAADEAVGEIQSDLLWEMFDFDVYNEGVVEISEDSDFATTIELLPKE